MTLLMLALTYTYLEPAEVKVTKTQAVLTYRLPIGDRCAVSFWGPPPHSVHVTLGDDPPQRLDANRDGKFTFANYEAKPCTLVAVFRDMDYDNYPTLIAKVEIAPAAQADKDRWLFWHKAAELAQVQALHARPGNVIAVTLWPQTAEQRQMVERELRRLLVSHPGAARLEIE